jgi:hypothetical protein
MSEVFTYRALVESCIMDFDKLNMKPVADLYRQHLAETDADKENYTARQALAVIAGTETPCPPIIVNDVDGKRVVPQRGFSAKGHRDCVELAQKTLRDL